MNNLLQRHIYRAAIAHSEFKSREGFAHRGVNRLLNFSNSVIFTELTENWLKDPFSVTLTEKCFT